MTDVRTAPMAAQRPGAVRPSAGGPIPRRLRPPGWLDLRLVLGVLLVLGSVLLGARAIDGADETVPVWAAATDLAAGSRLSAADVVAVDVRLDEAAEQYLATSTQPAGRVLARAVGAGELLPRSVVTEASGMVRLPLPVPAGYLPADLARGQVVDVYALGEPAADGGPGAVAPVASAVTVQDVAGRSDGALSSGTATLQLVVMVSADSAPGVLAAIAGRPLVVVAHDSVDGAAPTRSSAAPTATRAPDPGTATPPGGLTPPAGPTS